MKRFFTLIFSLVALCCMAACGHDDDTTPGGISLSLDEVTFPAEGGMKSVVLTGATADKVEFSTTAKWLTATALAGKGNSCYLRFTAAATDAYEIRTADVEVAVGTAVLHVGITQDPLPAPEPEPVPTDAFRLGQSLGLGWNLGNQLDAVDNWSRPGEVIASETAWGNAPATQATFDGIAEKGFKWVRIPITWQGHVGNAPGYLLEEAWLKRVDEVVGYARAAGLKVIINTHHDEGGAEGHYGFLNIRQAAYDATLNAAVKAQLSAMWRQIAEHFKDVGEELIFEGVNEVQDGGWGNSQGPTGNLGDGGKQYQCLNEWLQVFVDAVRSVGGENANRWLAVTGYCQNPTLTAQHLVLPTDPTPSRLLVSVHCYDPFDYAIEAKYGEWGHTSSIAATRNGESALKATAEMLRKAFVDRGIPVYIGECGATNRDSERATAFQRYYLQYFVRCFHEQGIPCLLWDNGVKSTGRESFGFIDHATGECINGSAPLIKSAVSAASTDGPSLADIYATAP